MSHRRARKDAKKAAAAGDGTIVTNVTSEMRGVGYGLRTFRAMQIGKPVVRKGYNVKRGPGYTTEHPIATKKARRKTNKRAKASRARNHV